MLKNTIKKIFFLIIIFIGFTGITNAAEYIYYYGDGCPHCHEVLKYFEKNNIEEDFDIEKKEIYFNNENREELLSFGEELGIALKDIGVPFLINSNLKTYYSGDKLIINLFDEKMKTKQDNYNLNFLDSPTCNIEKTNNCSDEELLDNPKSEVDNFWKFLIILLPAAISDSINPCAFAVLFLLLSSILSKFTSYRKAIYSGLLFSLAIFISYFLMGIGLYKVLSFSNQIFYIKLTVGILGILVGLANLKDYFWYGKGFVMEVPFSWRPMMKSLLNKVVSPLGAFFIGFVVSLFLLPCTSGPYFTILGYLASESSAINFAGYIYMLIYNVVFILPMIILTLVVGMGIKQIDELKEIKEYHTENIHLIVGILMLGLGSFIMWELFLK